MKKIINLAKQLLFNISIFIIGGLLFLPVMIWIIGATFIDLLTIQKN